MDLCNFKADKDESMCPRKTGGEPSEALSYQQQILAQAKSLGQLRRHYVVRKCYEENIDERKALTEICKYKACYPTCSELQLLEVLIKAKACPDTIIYQTYVVEAERGKCTGADETFRKLKQKPLASRKRLILPCCDEEHPIGSSLRQYGNRMAQKEASTSEQKSTASSSRPGGTTPRQQSTQKSSPYPLGPPRQPPRPSFASRTPCSPCAVPPSVCPGPKPPSPPPRTNLTPCKQTESPCPTSQGERPDLASTPLQEGGGGYFGSPGKTPAFLLSPGQTPVTKRKTKIPVAIRQDLTKSQKRQPRDTTGSRIPCPITTQVPRSTRFSRVRDEESGAPASRRKITFGNTQVSYFEDTIPSLVGASQLEDSQSFAAPLSPAMVPQQPKQFNEYKSMIDQEKKEIREMHNVVTQLIERPDKVEFRDMYSLVPQISYIDETLTETAPEVAAAMLHSDELGLNMKSPPAEVYNTLFKGGDMDKTLIRVTPEDNAKSVAPLSSEGFEATLLGYEQQGLFENVSADMDYDLPEMPQRKPEDEKEDDEGEEQGRRSTRRDEQSADEEGAEQPPDDEDDQEPVPPPRMSSKRSGRSEDSNESLFDVQLQIDLQSTSDFLQIRGSQPPSWFPGYFVAMGDSTKINVVQKPWDVLEKAWRKFDPSTMKPENGTYVLGI